MDTRFVESGGVRIAYMVEGEGDAIILPHGEGDTGISTQRERFEKENVYYGIPIYVMEDLAPYDQFTDSSRGLPYIENSLAKPENSLFWRTI